MIKAILVFNNHGKPRLSKFYEFYVSIFLFTCLFNSNLSIFFLFCTQPEDVQQQIIRETFQLVSKRDENVCNFLEGGRFVDLLFYFEEMFTLVFILFSLIGGSDYKLIYRHYATLYFVFCVDSSESELGILDLIQVILVYSLFCLCLFYFLKVFVETLDKCFENVCELDLIFHVDKVCLFCTLVTVLSLFYFISGSLYFERIGYGRHGSGNEHVRDNCQD